ncbi:MAG: hypothetical protein LQ337_005616 [Flavoplaca oasis]|nr:MAG: hypothetical protein LQ337_005616 [Flavoplaca oasis]
MVFKPFTHLARQSIGKTFTHGYAQSVVAATQSSYASSTTPLGFSTSHAATRFSKHGTSQLHTTFQHSSTSSAFNASNAQHDPTPEAVTTDGGLAAYYEAWQKQQRKNGRAKEWKQFQFPLRIGWQAPSVVLDSKSTEKDSTLLRPETSLERGSLDRAYSTSAVDDIKKAEDAAAEVAAVAQVDEAIAHEITNLKTGPAVVIDPPTLEDTASGTVHTEQTAAGKTNELSSTTPESIDTFRSSERSASWSDDTVPTLDSIQSENIVKLRDNGLYTEIPAAFEAMLAEGIRPSVEAYNALLAAATVLPAAKHQVVPKALGIYTSMLRQQVLPDGAFLTTLLQLLSHRAIDVHQLKRVMDVKRLRFGELKKEPGFLFRSDEGEYAILSEDDALDVAVKIFDSAVAQSGNQLLTSEVYRSLVTACALNGQVEAMIRIYSHLEKHNVTPMAAMFPPMIEAFARPGDLKTAVECYNAYKEMVIQDDAGHNKLLHRSDNEVYAAVIKGYALCGKHEGGDRFFAKIVKSLDSVEANSDELLENARDVIITHGLIQHRLDIKQYSEALKIAEEHSMTPIARSNALVRICSAAADSNDMGTAIEAYQLIETKSTDRLTAALAMLALHLRLDQIEDARLFWSVLHGSSQFDASLIEPTTMYAKALIERGHIGEGITQARIAFARMRSFAKTTAARDQVKERIDEAIELLASSFTFQQIIPSPQASMDLLWTMIENNGPVSPVSERLLAGLGPEAIAQFGHQDIVLLLQLEADMIANGAFQQDVAHVARFEHLLKRISQDSDPLDEVTVRLVERTLMRIEAQRPDLLMKWRYTRQMTQAETDDTIVNPPTTAVSSVAPSIAYSDDFDPYAATFDHRGSNIILDELDNPRLKSAANLDNALLRFRNMRRVGRHPRYMVYAKLITAAAKESRVNLIFDLLGMAKQDVAFLPQYTSVRDGWASILDSMIGACLTVGRRRAASDFHQELLQMGSAPTANTFGLYITTLKESTRSFDEAREAVEIFHRAKSEGVEPSAFLYNALIGKLGKARRIDDCLWYFTEMRSHGIRPTSVTYGTIVNALCRVSNERHAEELFDEMESMPNYKPRPAPYNSLMQFFLTTKRDSQKVLEYYSRMVSNNIQPTMHTYKLLIDTYATLEPIDMGAAEGVMNTMRASGLRPDAVHYAALVHAKGCALHDMAGARATFDAAVANGEVRPQACLYQALFESMVANHCVEETEELLEHMGSKGVEMTPYIANTLIHGWSMARDVAKARSLYERIGMEKREPSTYEAMTRALLSGPGREQALEVVQEMLSRGYPSAVTNKVVDLIGHVSSRAASIAPVDLVA